MRFFSALLCSMATEILQVKKLSEHAVLPLRGSEFAAGFDLCSAYDTVVPARGKALVKTDLSIAIPENTYARIAPRSGLAVKNFLDTGAGVVDYDYRGPVGVVLFNHGEADFEIKRGDRIAQLILERISMANIVEVEELSSTARGAGGFGSTGVSGSLPAQEAVTSSSSTSSSEVVDAAVAKRQKSTSVPSELLIFLHEVSPIIGADRVQALKPLALSGDVRLLAAHDEYNHTKSSAELLSTLDIVLASTASK